MRLADDRTKWKGWLRDMANGMGSLYIGASGLQNSQNALNTTANNLANVDTKGYVRQQVLFADRDYLNIGNASISKQQTGLGLNILDVVHTRDYFLDRYYRTENGRQSFYEATGEVTDGLIDVYQELEGEAFQDTLQGLLTAFQEMSKGPEVEVYQNLVVQKSTVFLQRVSEMYRDMKEYQSKINIKINQAIDRINELGHKLVEYNKEIVRIEAGGIETAMTLRDERDNVLDELSNLAKVDFSENVDGSVRVRLENVEFVNDAHVYEIKGMEDPVNGFVNPIWPQLSDMDRQQYTDVFNFTVDISSELNTDIGRLKALVLARGDRAANYTDVSGLTADAYNNGAGMSVMMAGQAELDQLVHKIVTAVNDILSPTKKVSFTAIDGTRYENARVWDEENACLGADGEKPGQELFVRRGCDRYTKVQATDGTIYYVYNEESKTDTSKMYCIQGLMINPALVEEESRIPHLEKNGEPAWGKIAEKMVNAWAAKDHIVNANNIAPCNFMGYYERMIVELSAKGNVYNGLATSLSSEVASIDNNRQQVFGVSSDEELTNMIKYQNAYNAASRFINVVSEMLEHLVTRL